MNVYIYIYTYTYLLKAVFKGIYSHLENEYGYRRSHLMSDICRYVIIASLSSYMQ